MSSRRSRVRWIMGGVAALFVGGVMVDALDLFDDKTWTEISHGNHSHFISYDKDKNVSVSDCPQRPPAAGEILSSQCQLITLVTLGDVTHYIPIDRRSDVPDDRFPVRPPGPGVVITPTGELAAADTH